tara:strand:- start:1011 stop:1421 length:411 start_codon:yes stop_codon:yes gene_type:complete
MALKTGSGTTVTFGTSGFTAKYTRIGGAELSRESIETTDLSIAPDASDTDGVYKTFVPDVLVDGGEFSCEFYWDPDATGEPPIRKLAPETITVTYKSGATMSGSGFVTSYTSPEAEAGSLLSAEFTVKWAGDVSFS